MLGGDLVGEVDGQDGRPAPAGDAGDADRLVLGRGVAELLGDAVHGRLEVVRLNRQRHDLGRPGPHRPEEQRRVGHRVHDRHARAGPGNTPTSCRTFGSWNVSGTCMMYRRVPAVLFAQGGDGRIDVGVLPVEGGLLVDQHAQDVALHTVLAADESDVEGVHAALRGGSVDSATGWDDRRSAGCGP